MLSGDNERLDQANLPRSLDELSGRFWALAVLTGVAAGLGAIAMMAVLRTVQHLAFSYHRGPYSSAAAAHGDLRRVLVVTGAGVIAGVGWWLMRRFVGDNGGSPTRAVWSGSGMLSLPRTALSGALSEVVIGMGASLGREAAPQHIGAAFGSWASRRCGLPPEQRILLLACGAGAGVGSVYNVPLAGALFAAELYLGSVSLVTVAPALLTAAVATVVGWLTLPRHAIYSVPHLGFPSASLVVWAVLAGPVIGIAAAAFVRLVAWAGDRRPAGRGLLIRPPLAFALLGVAAIGDPLLLGNGRDLTQFAFSGAGALSTLAILALLKPLVTVLCLGSGASGGLFTPTMSTGAVLGALLGHLWALVWPGAAPAACAVVGAAAMLGAGMQAPLAALAFTIELTDTVNASMVAILLALAGAMLVARRLVPLTIYSARLPAGVRPASHRVPGARGGPPGGGAGGLREPTAGRQPRRRTGAHRDVTAGRPAARPPATPGSRPPYRWRA